MDNLRVPSSSGQANTQDERRGRRNSRPRGSPQRPQSGAVQETFPTKNLDEHYGRKMRHWHNRPQSPKISWRNDGNGPERWRGRVFCIDFFRLADSTIDGARKANVREIHHLGGLKRLYEEKRDEGVVLRVIHVQNAPWAEKYLANKFNMAGNKNELLGGDFAKYICGQHPVRKGKRPRVGGKAWETRHDPWRGVSKTAFGIDYLMLRAVVDGEQQYEVGDEGKMLELNCYDEETEMPRYGFDVHAQRMCVYVQHKESDPKLPDEDDPNMQSPYSKESAQRTRGYTPDPSSFDNGNAVIIFSKSSSESLEDTMIDARGKWETRWRLLGFYLAYEFPEATSDDAFALFGTRMIISDVWKALGENWQHFISKADNHVEILESKIYERPADESHADEIWTNSSNWLRCERLVYVQDNVIKTLSNSLRELTDDSSGSEWLEASVGEFERIKALIEEDLVKPTASLSDLMYKSVGIRDTRHSLELSYSMWRLSWITFIFLPLTFTVGFFGMNVDTFSNDPNIKWFFISAAPLMTLVLTSWYFLKRALAQSRQATYSRGIYERLFHDLATAHPKMWSRGGPSGVFRPRTRYHKLKWWLVTQWNESERTIMSQVSADGDQFDGLTSWSRFKRVLTRRWTEEISRDLERKDPDADHGEKEDVGDKTGTDEEKALPRGSGVGRRKGPRNMRDMAQRDATASIVSPKAAPPEENGRPVSQGSSGVGNSGVITEEQGLGFVDIIRS